MGKVRKLRKKYSALCAKTRFENEKSNSKPPIDVQSLISNCDARSTYSISKSIKSTISGIHKKDKQKLRHAIFLQKVNASSEVLQNIKKNRNKKQKKIHLKDNLPSIINTSHSKSPDEKFKNLKTNMKPSHNRKGISKLRQKALVQDVALFKKTLNDKSFLKNPSKAITESTLNKLDKESIELNSF